MHFNDALKKEIRSEGCSQQSISHGTESFEDRRKMRSLNRQCERDIVRLERVVGGMETGDKSLACEWINKLRDKPLNLNEALARKYILSHLLRFNEQNAFTWKPFSKPSVLKSLSKLTGLMPMMSMKKKSVIELVANSVDNGEFLYKLPVPRDGAFFILHLSPNL